MSDWEKWAFKRLRQTLRGRRVIFWGLPKNGKIQLSVMIRNQWRLITRVWDANPTPPLMAGVPDYVVFGIEDEIRKLETGG